MRRPAARRRSVPSRSNSLIPRMAHHSQSIAVAPTKRSAACHSGGTSVTVVLIRICWKPQNRQQASSSEIASVSSCCLRSVIAAMVAGAAANARGPPAQAGSLPSARPDSAAAPTLLCSGPAPRLSTSGNCPRCALEKGDLFDRRHAAFEEHPAPLDRDPHAAALDAGHGLQRRRHLSAPGPCRSDRHCSRGTGRCEPAAGPALGAVMRFATLLVLRQQRPQRSRAAVEARRTPGRTDHRTSCAFPLRWKTGIAPARPGGAGKQRRSCRSSVLRELLQQLSKRRLFRGAQRAQHARSRAACASSTSGLTRRLPAAVAATSVQRWSLASACRATQPCSAMRCTSLVTVGCLDSTSCASWPTVQRLAVVQCGQHPPFDRAQAGSAHMGVEVLVQRVVGLAQQVAQVARRRSARAHVAGGRSACVTADARCRSARRETAAARRPGASCSARPRRRRSRGRLLRSGCG